MHEVEYQPPWMKYGNSYRRYVPGGQNGVISLKVICLGEFVMREYYEIKVKGLLDLLGSEWFAELQLAHLEGNETLLSGPLSDQAALHDLLERICDLNLTLLSVIICNFLFNLMKLISSFEIISKPLTNVTNFGIFFNK